MASGILIVSIPCCHHKLKEKLNKSLFLISGPILMPYVGAMTQEDVTHQALHITVCITRLKMVSLIRGKCGKLRCRKEFASSSGLWPARVFPQTKTISIPSCGFHRLYSMWCWSRGRWSPLPGMPWIEEPLELLQISPSPARGACKFLTVAWWTSFSQELYFWYLGHVVVLEVEVSAYFLGSGCYH